LYLTRLLLKTECSKGNEGKTGTSIYRNSQVHKILL